MKLSSGRSSCIPKSAPPRSETGSCDTSSKFELNRIIKWNPFVKVLLFSGPVFGHSGKWDYLANNSRVQIQLSSDPNECYYHSFCQAGGSDKCNGSVFPWELLKVPCFSQCLSIKMSAFGSCARLGSTNKMYFLQALFLQVFLKWLECLNYIQPYF